MHRLRRDDGGRQGRTGGGGGGPAEAARRPWITDSERTPWAQTRPVASQRAWASFEEKPVGGLYPRPEHSGAVGKDLRGWQPAGPGRDALSPRPGPRMELGTCGYRSGAPPRGAGPHRVSFSP